VESQGMVSQMALGAKDTPGWGVRSLL